MKKRVLVTGAAGFIGFHLVSKLLKLDFSITGIDNFNDYYDPELKKDRVIQHGIDPLLLSENPTKSSTYNNYFFFKMNLEDSNSMESLFEQGKFDIVINLAAQAGVRYSLINPKTYINSNMVGFFNVLECCKKFSITHLIYASSSSVYGMSKNQELKITDSTDHPISLYAATKKSNELMAHVYSHLFNFSVTGLRFFTVYGPWGRPDMAISLFTKSILEGKPIDVFNEGKLRRDFTYIDDIVEGITRVIGSGTDKCSNTESNYKLYNIGNNQPVELMDFIRAIEDELGIKAKLNFKPMQPGDVESTNADVSDFISDFSYKPKINITAGIKMYINWYTDYYSVKN